MHDLVPFAQFKKREKHPWMSVTLLKLTLLHGCFSRFLYCTNGTKSRKASHIIKNVNDKYLLIFVEKKNFYGPFYGWGSTTSRLESHFEEAVYF